MIDLPSLRIITILPIYRIIGAEGHDSAIWQPVVDHTSPQPSAIEIVGIHEMHGADKEEVEMEVAQILIRVALHELDKELF
jgi:hypothetical protein